jgi:hypothetical protein
MSAAYWADPVFRILEWQQEDRNEVLTREENLARKRVLEQTACLGGTISKSVNSESAQGAELYTQDDGFHLDGQLCVLYALNFIGTALDFYKCDV